ncbi:MAG TPA: adenosylcobinamide-GDP ribazoletransferase [Candidatus Blautia pullicola]|uniref:Adenosylcobinamide-GDP ribazoletransferase n=1 Tax=Candidatus Blautia pullicola TaxID=2838498 RepID=A0A9D2JSP9_9FIRM|nr:adenosylcobinamide-GDP ribazoletransferase [Candidatus Blautia pullicola]
MKQLWNSFKIAFAMYSKIPMPQSHWTKENMRYIMCFFPLIGVVIGALTWLWGLLGLKLEVNHSFYAVVLLLIPVAVTGGIHLDGLLDTSDALHSYQPRERKLEILKDSHAGAFAIITACVYFLFYLGLYHEISLKGLPVVCLGFVLSRALGGFSIAAFPMAKNTGLAATFSDNAQKQCVKVVCLVYGCVAGLLMLVYHPLIGGCALLAAALEYLCYYRVSMKEFGGITGDLAGFHMQLCELAITLGAVVGEIIGRGM